MGRKRYYSPYYDGYFYDYYQSSPIPVENGIKAKSQRGDIGETWWSKRWVGVLESFGIGSRLARGRNYARRGQVLSIDVKPGIVKAKVQGSRPEPYNVTIKLQPISDQDWEKVTNAMASQAVFAAKLLSGEMPKNIEEAFQEVKVSLFPKSHDELNTDCSCPDIANPCKHIAAVYYLLAERFDEDPFLIFKLRGRTKEEIIETLREKRVETLHQERLPEPKTVLVEKDALSSLEECLDTFWDAGENLDTLTFNLTTKSAVDKSILKRLGDVPFTVEGHNITHILSKAYDLVRADALKRASIETREMD
ncbi:MAG: SWIM zinc finger family protein [Candidatus Freyarchaeota archaeon]|nr:SWIM zinc finger family protein [Candidatus Jordarchaeia archaeon]MBS7280738.1 SWIM zinc finger family protein [Candidatus Jordarchaeia archaeon]